MVLAAQMAVDAVNSNETILRDYNLRLAIDNGECKTETVMSTFIQYILFNKYRKMVGILGKQR